MEPPGLPGVRPSLYGSGRMSTWTLSFKSSFSGVLAINTLCIHEEPVGLGVGDLGAATVVADLDTWLRPLYRACINSAWRLDAIAVRELGTSSPTVAEVGVGLAGTLANGTGNLPREICQVVKITTALATRSGRGRVFMPSPFYSSYLDGPDSINTAGGWWTSVKALFDALIAGRTVTHDLVDHHYSLNVWSRKQGQRHDATGYVQRQAPHWLRSRATAP